MVVFFFLLVMAAFAGPIGLGVAALGCVFLVVTLLIAVGRDK